MQTVCLRMNLRLLVFPVAIVIQLMQAHSQNMTPNIVNLRVP